MSQWYVYVSEYGQRVYVNIYEAETKEEVKKLLLEDTKDWLTEVKQRNSKNGLNQYITAMHEISGGWVDVFLKETPCKACLMPFRKIEKLKYNTGGRADFCSDICDREYSEKLDPGAVGSWNNGTVYKITHVPTGKFYVGVTTRWLMKRWWEHIKAESGSEFHKFIKDHDLSEFTFQVLESFKPSEVDPFEREAHWINTLNAVEIGLNSVSGHKAKVIEVVKL